MDFADCTRFSFFASNQISSRGRNNVILSKGGILLFLYRHIRIL